jgi:hypothetical protein
MRTLIRRVVTTAGQQGWSDSHVEGDALGLGRGTDQQIHIPDHSVALKHAQIQLGGQITLRGQDSHDVSVNGQVVRSAVLNVGDYFQLGRQRITVLPPPDASVALALQLEAIVEQPLRALDASRFRMRLADIRWLRQRPVAWLAFLLMLSLFLAVPIVGGEFGKLARTVAPFAVAGRQRLAGRAVAFCACVYWRRLPGLSHQHV